MKPRSGRPGAKRSTSRRPHSGSRARRSASKARFDGAVVDAVPRSTARRGSAARRCASSRAAPSSRPSDGRPRADVDHVDRDDRVGSVDRPVAIADVERDRWREIVAGHSRRATPRSSARRRGRGRSAASRGPGNGRRRRRHVRPSRSRPRARCRSAGSQSSRTAMIGARLRWAAGDGTAVVGSSLLRQRAVARRSRVTSQRNRPIGPAIKVAKRKGNWTRREKPLLSASFAIHSPTNRSKAR